MTDAGAVDAPDAGNPDDDHKVVDVDVGVDAAFGACVVSRW